jgi:hypothetical protein
MALGQFTPGSSESMEWFWRGTNPNATGSSWTSDGRTMLAAAPPAFQEQIAAASEAERSGLYRAAAVQFMRDRPGDAVRLYVTKLKSFWLGSDATGLLYPPTWTVLYDLWYGGALVLAAVGAWFGWRARAAQPMVVLIAVSLLVVSASQAVFYVEGRHRLAIEPLLLVLSGAGLVCLARFLPSGQVQRVRGAGHTHS